MNMLAIIIARRGAKGIPKKYDEFLWQTFD